MLILIPVDGSKASQDAVHHVLTLRNNGLAARVLLVNVQESPHLYEMMLLPDAEAIDHSVHEVAVHALESASELLTSAGAQFACETLTGEIGHGIIDAAERSGCDAIVMGNSNVGLLGGSRLGAVGQWVLMHATVPVTIVPHIEE